MKSVSTFVLLVFSSALVLSGQVSGQMPSQAKDTRVREYWLDPATGLMWAGKDNGKDVDWHRATNYCRDLRLAGHSDWRLPTIDELQTIYDRYTSDLEQATADNSRSFVFGFRVKGNLSLTGFPWSSTRGTDSRGRLSGSAYRADPLHGRFADFLGYRANLRALCVRGSGN